MTGKNCYWVASVSMHCVTIGTDRFPKINANPKFRDSQDIFLAEFESEISSIFRSGNGMLFRKTPGLESQATIRKSKLIHFTHNEWFCFTAILKIEFYDNAARDGLQCVQQMNSIAFRMM